MPISTEHPYYKAHVNQWSKCRDCFKGEDATKAAGDTYLPKISSIQTPAEYASYLMRGYFFEVVPRAVAGLVGAATRKRAIIEGPDDIVEIATPNIIREMIRELLVTGRYGLLVDIPMDGSSKPYLVGRPAEQVINWREEDDRLVLVVMSETREVVKKAEDATDDYGVEVETWFRELRLIDGVYTVKLWKPESEDMWALAEEIIPQASNKTLDFIPFTFVSPRGVTDLITQPPILGLANANLWHYRHFADYSHGLHLTGLPTPWVTGFNAIIEEGAVINELQIGSSTIWLLEQGGQAGYLEFTGQGLTALREALKDMEHRMALIGARLLESDKRAAEAAETVRLKQSAESATLINIVTSAGDALQNALEQAARWLGQSEEITVQMNTDFISERLSAEEIKGLLEAFIGGAMSLDTFIFNLARGEILPEERTIDEEKTLIEEGHVPAVE